MPGGAGGLLVVSVGGGALAFSWLEGWALHEAAYFCVVTSTSIGYGDHPQLAGGGRLRPPRFVFLRGHLDWKLLAWPTFLFENNKRSGCGRRWGKVGAGGLLPAIHGCHGRDHQRSGRHTDRAVQDSFQRQGSARCLKQACGARRVGARGLSAIRVHVPMLTKYQGVVYLLLCLCVHATS